MMMLLKKVNDFQENLNMGGNENTIFVYYSYMILNSVEIIYFLVIKNKAIHHTYI